MSLWPTQFDENNKPSAKNLLEEQAKLLPKLTNDMVYAEVTALSDIDASIQYINDDFSFRFDIRGKFLENYRFTVFTFSHDITLYPVKFKLDEKIAKELGVTKQILNGYIQSIDAPEQLTPFLARVLNSERLKSVVGSIIRLSK